MTQLDYSTTDTTDRELAKSFEMISNDTVKDFWQAANEIAADLNASNDIAPYYYGQPVLARWHSCTEYKPARVRYCGKTFGIGFVALNFCDTGSPATLPYENVKPISR